MDTLRWTSLSILVLNFGVWVVALGGLASLNWLKCNDGVRPNGQSVPYCSRPYKFHWWALIFQLAVLLLGLIATLVPNWLKCTRHTLAYLLTMTTVLGMIVIDECLDANWTFWDAEPDVQKWPTGRPRDSYLSVMAETAGFIMFVIFNFFWIIACTTTCCEAGSCQKAQSNTKDEASGVDVEVGQPTEK